MVPFLFENAVAGRIKLAGLDPQLGGSTQLFSQQRLPAQLTATLSEPRRAECEKEISRHTTWQYDDNHPYDGSAQGRLKVCAKDIQRAAPTRSRSDATSDAALMAANFSRYLEMSSDDGKNLWALRDRAMFDNLQLARTRLGKDAKAIVWCATVHAAKQLPPGPAGRDPMGSYLHRALGDKAAAIGFTALAGSVGQRGNKAMGIPAASAESLEQRALAGSTDELRYLDRKQLHALGIVPAHPLDHGRLEAMDWSAVLDGLVVLREERPVSRVRSARPQQAARGIGP